MSVNIRIPADLLIRMVEEGNFQFTNNQVKNLNVNLYAAQGGAEGLQTRTTSLAYASRRFAMNLRMLSIGLMILKREYGGLNPVFDAGITTLYVLSAGSSVLLASTSMLSQGYGVLKKAAGEGGTALKGLDNIIKAMPAGPWILATAIASLVGIGVFTWAFESYSGISILRKEIRGLKDDLKELESSMRDLSVTQAQLNAQTARFSYQEKLIQRNIELRGFATKEETAQLLYLSNAQADAGVTAAKLNMQKAEELALSAKGIDTQKDYEEAIDKTWKTAAKLFFGKGERVMGGPGGFTPPPPGAQLGVEIMKAGLIYAHAGEVVAPREQVSAMVQGGGETRIAVSISLAGATISGVSDLRSAMREGGDIAGQRIRNKLEILRRRPGRSRM